ncbi:hypothetical protein [Glycomyces sp. YM15]|uniref:hypothetical protein n=1 Tax=Glycomyces sp. YM15 TaxID=2800446 RepID=UPI001966945B|nr:hypothetical protein [Glycomyces sp. YM15]
MVELVLAGVIVGAIGAAAVVTGILDHRRRRRREAETEGAPSGEPIPGGWTAPGDRADPAAGTAAVR